MPICDRLAAKFTPLEVEKIVDKKNKIKRFINLLCMCSKNRRSKNRRMLKADQLELLGL